MSATAELALDASRFVLGLSNATVAVQQFKGAVGEVEGMNRLKAAALTATAAVIAAGVAFVQGVRSAISLGNTLQETSYKAGLTVRQMQTLGEALRMVGGSSEDAGPMIKSMQDSIKSAVGGSESATVAFSKLGLSADALSKMSTAKQVDTITAAFGGLHNGLEKTQTAVSIFGASGERMVAAMNPTTFAGASKALGDQATILERASGMFARITTIMGLSGSTLMDVVAMAKTKLQGFFVGVAAGFAPEILSLIEGPKKGLSEIVAEFGKVHPALAPVVDIVQSLIDLDLASAGVKIGAAFGGVAEAMKSGELVGALKAYVAELKSNLLDAGMAFAESLKIALSGLADLFIGKFQVGLANVIAAMRADSIVFRQLVSDESVGKMTRQGLAAEVKGKKELEQVLPTLKPVTMPSTALINGALDTGKSTYGAVFNAGLLANPTQTNIRQEPVVPVMAKVLSESQNQTAILQRIAEQRAQSVALK